MSLGKVLVTMEAVTKDQLREVIADQIEHTIYELVARSEGEFDFALDELRPVDDIAVYPGDILPDINLNTQIVVLEALRIFDEKNRDRALADSRDGEDSGEDEPGEAAEPEMTPAEGADADFEALVSGSAERSSEVAKQGDATAAGEREGDSKQRFQIVTDDRELFEQLREGFRRAGGRDGGGQAVGIRD